jgi:hypothetical protein
MADTKISALPAASGVTADDLLAIVDDPGGAPVTQKATAAQLAAYIGTTALVQVYQGRAPAAPDDPTRPALDYPVGGGSLQQWNVGTAAWV